MSKRRITPVEIAIGTALSFDAYDAHGRLLLRKGQVINSRSQIDGLMERGLFVLDNGVQEKQVRPKTDVPPSAVSLVLEARRRLQAICAADVAKTGFSEAIF